MRKYVYYRCSTDGQEFDQQKECVMQYFARNGMDYDKVDGIVTEKVSGSVLHTERNLYGLLRKCGDGDVIYISELSRLGRSMSDLFSIVNKASLAGTTIIQCKDGALIENKTIGGKAILFALSLASEIELDNIRQRTRMALSAKRDEIAKNGYFISKAGNKCTHVCGDNGGDKHAGGIARGFQITTTAIAWRKNSVGYNAVRRWVSMGWSNEDIIKEFNAMNLIDPVNYRTRNGGELTISILKGWRAEFKAGCGL